MKAYGRAMRAQGHRYIVMRGSTRLLKRLMALFLVVLMSINTLAAVVGDNDGAAFITKAEFDSMKNDFQTQLDRYNSSIDNKIDGAIASYLAGISVAKTNTLDVINRTWGKVTMLNAYPNNVYVMPETNLSYQALWQTETGDFDIAPNYNWWKGTSWWFCKIVFERTPTMTKCERLLCDAGKENTNPVYVIWEGRSTDLKESFVGSWTDKNDYATTKAEGVLCDTNMGNTRLWLANIMTFNNGYWPNAFNNASSVWDIGTWYRPGYWSTMGNGAFKTYGTGTGCLSIPTTNESLSLNVYLLSVDGKTKKDEHVLTYGNITFDQFTDVDWKNTLNQGSTNTWSCQYWLDVCTKTGGMRLQESAFEHDDHSVPKGENANLGRFISRNIDAYYANGDGTTDTRIPVSIGLLSSTYNSEHILQTENKIEAQIGGKTYDTGNPLNLYNGLPVLYGSVTKQHRIRWKPVFKTYINGTENNFDVRVSLIMNGKWLNETNREAGTLICKNQGQVNDYLITSGGTCTFDFDVPGEGIIYAKWWPDSTAILAANNWRIDLDLENCGTFELIEQ